jgi:thiopeptide-type bacteriocin biosynthesis protein
MLTVGLLEVAVFSLNQFFSDWGFNFPKRLQWAKSYIHKYETSKDDFRSHRKYLCELLSPTRIDYNTELETQRNYLLSLFAMRGKTIGEAASNLRLLADNNELWQIEQDILASLTHIHINRLLGVDRKQERKVMVFWLHTLESLHLRPDNICKSYL